ncbi:MAG: hypothetical protein K2P78_05080 [Gemmataceae bacterium]|nr:hypothetical protein [Gemmataceae bacterium]
MSRITTLVPWFGSARMIARHVGTQLRGCSHVTVPFAGGCSELRHIGARTLVVGDLNRHVINLANVLRCPVDGPRLIRDLRRTPFHEDALRAAQAVCAEVEAGACPVVDSGPLWERLFNYAWARAYFTCAWMTRSGDAGTGREFRSAPSVRWHSVGGDSVVRFRSAAEALRDWRRLMPRCNFLVADAFDLLAKVLDRPDCGAYCDPPFPGPGRAYAHHAGRTEADERAWHERLRDAVSRFGRARVVLRFYRHPLVEELYPAPRWRWLELPGRTQTNAAAPEVLVVNGDIYTEDA